MLCRFRACGGAAVSLAGMGALLVALGIDNFGSGLFLPLSVL